MLMLIISGFFILMGLIQVFATWHISSRNLMYIGMFSILSYGYYRKRKQRADGKETPASEDKKSLKLAFFVAIIILVPTGIIGHRNRVECADIKHYETAIDACTTLISFGEQSGEVFNYRGAAYLNAGMYDRGIEDFDSALRLEPNGTMTLVLRGNAYLLKGQYDNAMGNFDKALNTISALDGAPNFKAHSTDKAKATVLFVRGMTKFYSISPLASIDDFATAVKLDSTDSFKVIWLHLARIRSGQDDNQELEHNSSMVLADKWPAPIINLYRGKATLEEVLAKAKIGNDYMKADQACDANFYVAEFYLQRGMKDEARYLFQAAAKTCHKGNVELGFAGNELKTMVVE